MAGIVLVLKIGIARNQLLAVVVGSSGVTCWRRLRNWTEARVWPALHELPDLRCRRSPLAVTMTGGNCNEPGARFREQLGTHFLPLQYPEVMLAELRALDQRSRGLR